MANVRTLTADEVPDGPAGVLVRSTSSNIVVAAEDGRTTWELRIATDANSGVSAAIVGAAELRMNPAGVLVANTHTAERTHDVVHPVLNGIIAAVSAGIRFIDSNADPIERLPAGPPSPPINITVLVPAGSDITVKSGSGSIRTTGVLGTIIATSATGEITIDTAEKADLVSASGTMTATRVHELTTNGIRGTQAYGQVHNAHIHTASGPVTILNLGYLAAVESHGGPVDITGPATATVRFDITDGQLTLRGGMREEKIASTGPVVREN